MNELLLDQSDRVLLRASDVEKLRQERDQLVIEINQSVERVSEIDAKLDAIALLTGLPIGRESPKPAVWTGESLEEESDDGESMAAAAIKIVVEANRFMSNAEIRRELEKVDEFRDRLSRNPNYYYTIMKRHADHGRLRKVDGKYGPPAQD